MSRAPSEGRHIVRSLPITLRGAQVRRISWVRGVRPARERCEWPPHITVSCRPPLHGQRHDRLAPPRFLPIRPLNRNARHKAGHDTSPTAYPSYLILDSRNSTCFFATGSYFFFTSLSVIVREFLRVT